MTLPVMPSTHTWVQGGPILARAGQAAIYAADSSQVWVWNEDTGVQVTDLRDANGNTISTVPVVNGRVDGVGVPVAVQLASFSIGQNGPRFFVLPVQTIRNAVSGGTANDTTVAGFVNTSGTSTRGALDGRYTTQSGLDSASASLVNTSGTATDSALKGIYIQIPASADQVLYVSARGNDSNSGLTWRKAKATVAGALAVVGSATGYRIEVGQGTITETVAWGTIPSNTVIRGQGKFATTILKAFNGDMFTPGQGVTMSDFTINGQGATYTGRIASITGTLGAQTFDRLKLFNGDQECIWFGYQAGSGFVANNCDIWRYNAASGSGRYAIVVEDVQQLGATPRSFNQLASGGQATFSFGGANDFFITQSFLNDLLYSANSAGVHIAASRLASPVATQSIRGSNNTIVACDVYAALQIESGYGGMCLGPNAYQNAPVDLSGLATNKIIHDSYAYTPVLTASGTAPSLGNATITGVFSRSGTVIVAEVDFTVGSTTTLGTGDLRFSLPYTRSSGQTSITGQAIIFPAGGSTQYTAAVQIVGAVGYVRLIRDTTGVVSGTSPATLATGSNIRIGITYRQ